MKTTNMTYIGIALVVIGLASIYFSAGTNWIYASNLLSAIGGAATGASLRKDIQ